jgi:hypothetical protein
MAFEPTEGLENEIQAAVSARRKELNELMFSLIQNQEILDGLEVKIRNAKFKKSIDISSPRALNVKMIAELKMSLLHESGREAILFYMFKRVESSKHCANQENLNILQAIREQLIKIRDTENLEKALFKKYNQNRSIFTEEKTKLHRKLGVFFQRLNWFENYFLEEKKFVQLYNRQMNIDSKLPEDGRKIEYPAKNLSKKYSALFKVKAIENKLARTLQSTLQEEQRYEDAFKVIGIRLGELDTSNIVNLCLHHESVLQELSDRATYQWKKNDELWKVLSKVVNSLQNEFYGANRTTNRDVLVMEKKLSEIKKALDEEVNEYEYAHCQQQPVYIGMQFLTKRLLGVDVSLSSLQNVHWVFKSYKNEIINTLKKMLELTSKLHDLHNNNVILENRKLSYPLREVTSDSWKSIGLVTSSNNIRVQASVTNSNLDIGNNATNTKFPIVEMDEEAKSVRSKIKARSRNMIKQPRKR